jgi:hypothetical protein
MNPKLHDIIYYFCKHYPKELTRVILIKLVYLTDVEFYRKYHRQTTDLVYEFDNHGPFTWDIVDETEKMFSDGLIDITELPSSFGGPKYVYKCKAEYQLKNLDQHTLNVLQDVNSYFSRFGFSELLDYVYNNPPTCLFKRGDIIDFSLWIPNFDLSAPGKIRANRVKANLARALAQTLKEKKFEFEDYEEDPNELKDNALLTGFSLLQSESTSREETD